jgi:signal transduction histidine kinase
VSDQRATVLLVDDNEAQRIALRAILGTLDVQPIEAASGREALRCLLHQEVAVILLDVNMPGLDGFETASLIRSRPRTEHTPIIFITAYADDAYAARGYSLGAVDYILAPVQPEVLRAKVAVFIELFNKTEQITRQREALRRYAEQLQRLSRASLSINSAHSVEEVLRVVAETAGEIIGAHQSAGTAAFPPLMVTQVSAAYGGTCEFHRVGTQPSLLAVGLRQPQRLSAAELSAQFPSAPELVSGRAMRGLLAAPLTGRDGTALGVLQLSDKMTGDFTEEDQGILVQLAQMATVAIENTVAAEARESNRLKDEFLGVLSHELRTPLQPILMWVGILRSAPENAALQTRGLEVIERSAKTQTQLIGDLLDVSRIIRGKLHLDARGVDLTSVVEQALEALRPDAVAKQVEMIWEAPPEKCATTGDPTRLQQVLWNLVSNAIKFTPAGGRVEVHLSQTATDVVVEVRDTGCGIPPQFLPHLFERFRQADSSAARQHGGLGLGLAIVRHLVELHGGMVDAANNADGHGAVFNVRLPRRGAEASAAAGRDGAAFSNGSRLDGVRVILVEDEADTRESLISALRLYGAEVAGYSEATAALRAVEAQPPDVLLSDIGMPGEDGYTLIRHVRAWEAPRGSRLPAVALTAYARGEDGAEALQAGFDAHVHKPIEPTDLARIVQRLAGRA